MFFQSSHVVWRHRVFFFIFWRELTVLAGVNVIMSLSVSGIVISYSLWSIFGAILEI